MKKIVAGFMLSTMFVSMLGTAGLAAPPKVKAKATKIATLKCPSCGMPMPTKKTATMSVPIKIKGTTYYCCAGCPSGKAALAASKKKK